MTRAIVSIFIVGLSFGMGTCVSSCGPLLLSYIAGTKKSALKGLIVYFLFSAARITAYLILGLAVFFLGRFAQERIFAGALFKYILLLGGLFIVFIGILMIAGKNLDFKFCRFLYSNVLERDKKSILIFGLTVGLLPCAPLLATLSVVGLTAKSWLESVLYSIAFGMGTVLSPLILLVIFAGFIPQFLGNNQKIYRIFSIICGLIIVILGIRLITKVF